MGLKQARIRHKSGRGGEIDADGFIEIMKDNWDNIRGTIMDMDEEDRANELSDLEAKIPAAKSLLAILYDEEGDVEAF